MSSSGQGPSREAKEVQLKDLDLGYTLNIVFKRVFKGDLEGDLEVDCDVDLKVDL